MDFVEVAKVDEIPAGKMKACKVGEREIVVINSGGKFYALNRRCTHMGGDLAEGKLEGATVRCPRHGAIFDVTTGRCLAGPKIGPLKLKTKDETRYEVVVEGRAIKIKV